LTVTGAIIVRVLRHPFPPTPSPAGLLARAAALPPSASDSVHAQHVVSQVLLKRFAEPDAETGGLKVYSFDLEYPNPKTSRSRLKGLSTVGQAPELDFVRFASRSVEERWGSVESILPETLAAVDQGTVFDDPGHPERLRDLVALHFARSIQSAIIRWRTWGPTYEAARKAWSDNLALLERVSRMRPGLYVAGQAGRELTLDDLYAEIVEFMESGAYFRVRVEDWFERIHTWLQTASVEILTAEDESEFLIGDIPALLMLPGYIGSGALDGVGLLLAESMVLPLGPGHAVKLGGDTGYTPIAAAVVDELNTAQVTAAFSHVFLRPDSGLDRFVRSVDRPKPSKGNLSDAYNRYKRR
jgi:uncharacterized protein DUF4238